METEFEKRIAALINEYSIENQSCTPDFILARYLNAALLNFNAAVMDREQWYGRIQHIEDQHYKIPFDYDGTGNPNIDPNYINTPVTATPCPDYTDVQPFCSPEQNMSGIEGKTTVTFTTPDSINGTEGTVEFNDSHTIKYGSNNVDVVPIGRPTSQRNFTPETEAAIDELHIRGEKLLESIRVIKENLRNGNI